MNAEIFFSSTFSSIEIQRTGGGGGDRSQDLISGGVSYHGTYPMLYLLQNAPALSAPYTDREAPENITFPQLRLRVVIKSNN